MNRILLVEDNAAIIRGLTYTLEHENFEVDSAGTTEKAKALVEQKRYDLALLDIMLPDGTGYEVCRELRLVSPETPVIFLTAKDGENEVVYGFYLGADDYVVKPFRNRELISRIQNVLRRYRKNDREITSGDVKVDLSANRVYRGGEEVTLTALEFRLLALLFQNQGLTLTREQILDRIWDSEGNVVNDNTLTVYIRRIREKLGEDVIRTVKGLGYRVED